MINDQTKLLGIILDENITWRDHIENISKKICKSIGILCTVKNILSKGFMLKLSKIFILPHTHYCNLEWGTTSETLLNKLEIPLNLCSLTPSMVVFSFSKALKIIDIKKLQTNNFMYKYKQIQMSDTNDV